MRVLVQSAIGDSNKDIWIPKCDISEIKTGGIVYGDLSTLGWVVVKCDYSINDYTFSKELMDITFVNNNWVSIGKNDKNVYLLDNNNVKGDTELFYIFCGRQIWNN